MSRVRTAAVAAAVVAVLFVASSAFGDDVRVATSGAFSAALAKLIPAFETETHHHVTTIFGASMGDTPDSIPNRLRRHEALDVVILAGSALTEAIRTHQAIAETRVDLVRSRIGMVVRTGAPKPDISSVDALTRTLRRARSVAYSSSASGVYLAAELFPRLGLSDEMRRKGQRIEAERVAAVVARGDAEVGFQQISELLGETGVDLVGPLPEGAQKVTIFSAAIVTGSRAMSAAKALLAYLASPAAAPAIRESGLDPIAIH